MDTATIGVAQKEDEEQGVDEEHIFYRMVFFLAAITLFLFSRILGADNASFRPVMGKRGEADVASGADRAGTPCTGGRSAVSQRGATRRDGHGTPPHRAAPAAATRQGSSS